MPRRGSRHFVLVKGAETAMLAFRMEIAGDLGFSDLIEDDDHGFRKLTTEQAGQIGGEMVRRIQAAGEWAIMERYKEGQQRLMPELPDVDQVRNVTNSGKKPS